MLYLYLILIVSQFFYLYILTVLYIIIYTNYHWSYNYSNYFSPQYGELRCNKIINFICLEHQIIVRKVITIKTNEIRINKLKNTTIKISVLFEDNKINPERYSFLKDSLNTYHLYLNSEYSIKSKIQYDKFSEQLLILINILIPDKLVPSDSGKAKETIMDPVNLFQEFYEVQNEIYKRKLTF